MSLLKMSIHRQSALQGRASPANENVTEVYPALGKMVQLREPSKSSSGHGLMAHSAASEGRRRLDRRANVQLMCGHILKKVGEVKEESNRGAGRSPRRCHDNSLETTARLLESEVATVKYVKLNSSIPVPEGFDYRYVP